MLNIAAVGCGYWGPNLIRNFASLPDCCMKLVCDANPDRLAHMRLLYPDIQTTGSLDDVLKDNSIDAVIIATPVRFHFDMARRSLEAGKHTFIEKPMATSTSDCRTLIKLAQQHNRTLMIGHTFIFSPPVRKIKEIYDSGDLGKLQYISSRRLNLGLFQTDINVVWDLAPHDISILLYILKQSPLFVNCQGKSNVNPAIEDVATLTIHFADSGFGTIQISWLDPYKVREMTFVGSKRMLVYNDIEPMEKLKIFDKRVDVPPHYDTFAEFHYSYHYGDIYSPYLKQIEPLRVECQHFLDCIKSGAKPEASGLEGLQVVQVLEASSESLRRGGAKVEIAAVEGN